MINVAILGYGTVGSGVFEVLNENKESISRRAGQELHVKYVLDLRDFPGQPVEKVLVHDYEQIVSDPEVDIVVEVMGGVEPAYTFVKKALLAGKNVCTSNKALVAKHGRELMEQPNPWDLLQPQALTSYLKQAVAAESRSFVSSILPLQEMRLTK